MEHERLARRQLSQYVAAAPPSSSGGDTTTATSKRGSVNARRKEVSTKRAFVDDAPQRRHAPRHIMPAAVYGHVADMIRPVEPPGVTRSFLPARIIRERW